MVKWFIATGAPRSGTTMLQNILNTNPDVVCTHETDFSLSLRCIEEMCATDAHHSSLIAKTGQCDDLDLSIGEVQNAEPSTAEEFVNRRENLIKSKIPLMIFPQKKNAGKMLAELVKYLANKPNATHLGDKLPKWDCDTKLDILKEHGINAKTINIVRNPLDVINSSLNRRENARKGGDIWPIETVNEAISEWLESWRFTVEHIDDPDVLNLKYEDLIQHFDRETGRIAQFLECTNKFENIVAPTPRALTQCALTDCEKNIVEQELSRILSDWEDNNLTMLAKKHRLILEDLEIESTLEFCTNPYRQCYMKNFQLSPTEGIWSIGDHAQLQFSFRPKEHHYLFFDFDIYPFFGNSSSYNVFVKINDQPMQCFDFYKFNKPETMHIRTICPADRDIHIIDFILPRTKLPEEEPLNDPREVGVLLKTLNISSFKLK